jgi:hypothetical protein
MDSDHVAEQARVTLVQRKEAKSSVPCSEGNYPFDRMHIRRTDEGRCGANDSITWSRFRKRFLNDPYFLDTEEDKSLPCLCHVHVPYSLGDWFLYQRSWKYSKLENRLRPMSKLTLLMGLVLPLTERMSKVNYLKTVLRIRTAESTSLCDDRVR